MAASKFLQNGANDGTDATFRQVDYASVTGTPAAPSPITNSLGADVLLNNTANYFDGPSVAQGTTGTWFVSGTVTCTDPVSANIQARLWDGTSIIASTRNTLAAATGLITMSLSGFITSPAGNLRISVKDTTATTGKILANTTGDSKDSTITAFRIA